MNRELKPTKSKTGGRRKGTPNKSTASVKAAMEQAFEQMGGVQSLVEWGRENQTDFYKLWAKLLPVQVSADGGDEGLQLHLYLPNNGRDSP